MKRRELLTGLAVAAQRLHQPGAQKGADKPGALRQPRPIALAGHHRHDLPEESHRERPHALVRTLEGDLLDQAIEAFYLRRHAHTGLL